MAITQNFPYDSIVVHYDEIGLKKGNRKQIEELLIKNIKKKLGPVLNKITRYSGQMTLFFNTEIQEFDRNQIVNTLEKIPGVSYFLLSIKLERQVASIRNYLDNYLSTNQIEFNTFKVKTKRSDKTFETMSMDINIDIGSFIQKKTKKKVSLSTPDITFYIEISNQYAFLAIQRVNGIGGMPSSSHQKVTTLLSGGFDSPVAAYLMMKRGCEVILVHFMNDQEGSNCVKQKIIDLANQLSRFQNRTKLYIVPFEEVQETLIMKVQSSMRMILYRKYMMMIAAKISFKEKAKFLVLGDSLSQVASQTIDNLQATYLGSHLPIFTPLIGLNKNEIIDISRNIGTYDISKLPYNDCCSYFLPKHPVLRTSKEDIEDNIAKIEDTDDLIRKAIKESTLLEF